MIYFAGAAAILFWMAMAALRSFIRRNEALAFLRVAVFGLVLFLLVWETQARYLVSFLPIFLLCAVEAGPRPKGVEQKPDAFEEEGVAEVNENNPEEPFEAQNQAYPDYMNPAFQWEETMGGVETAETAPLWEEIMPEEKPPPPTAEQDLFSLMQDE